MARSRLPALKSLEKSRLKSWLRASPFLYRSLFLLCFLPSFLSSLCSGSDTAARFAHYFPFSFILPRAACSPRGVAPRKGPPYKKTISSFYTIRRATVRSLRCISSSAYSRRCISLSEAIVSKQVRYLSHITRFFFLNKSNIIVEATARSEAPCSSN